MENAFFQNVRSPIVATIDSLGYFYVFYDQAGIESYRKKYQADDNFPTKLKPSEKDEVKENC